MVCRNNTTTDDTSAKRNAGSPSWWRWLVIFSLAVLATLSVVVLVLALNFQCATCCFGGACSGSSLQPNNRHEVLMHFVHKMRVHKFVFRPYPTVSRERRHHQSQHANFKAAANSRTLKNHTRLKRRKQTKIQKQQLTKLTKKKNTFTHKKKMNRRAR